jgi:hypothetical protein
MHYPRSATRRMLLAGAVALAATGRATAQPGAPPSGLIAIDVLLEPGQAMLDRAAADNARLRGNHPGGFALDSAHTPHVTLLQAFVDAADLPRVQGATGGLLDAASPIAWQLTAIGRYYLPTDGMGLAGITIRPTPDLLRLQAALVEAMAPFTRRGATAAAFDGPGIPATSADAVAYIDGFATDRTGARYNPHVTTGLGQEAFVRAMVAEPFQAFKFGITGSAIFHLGVFGTANRRLWSWVPGRRS